MTKKRFTELNIGDTFIIEYGDYDNYTNAVIVAIEPTVEYNFVKIVTYTIPRYTGDELHQCRMRTDEWIDV